MVLAPRSFARLAAGSRANRRAQLTSPAWAGGARSRERSVGGRVRERSRAELRAPCRLLDHPWDSRDPGYRLWAGGAVGEHSPAGTGGGGVGLAPPPRAPRAPLLHSLAVLRSSRDPGARWRRPAGAQTTTRRPRYSLARSPASSAPSGSEQRAATVSGDGSGARSA